jgi:NAD(P)-dependent dehydrogenase (short-subunit alcohol dehydrogenase family)
MSDGASYEHLFRLDGRTALVVGAGSGIGAASAEGLAAFGASVVCADADEAAAANTTDRIGDRATTCRLDLLDGASVEAAAAEVGAPDILVTTPAVNVRKPIVDYTDDDLDRVVDLNLKGTFRLCRTFGRSMAAAGRGSMIGFSSIRSQTTEPGQGAYAATKAATVMLFKTLAAELGPRGVRANTIAPGVVETPLTAPIKADAAWYGAYAAKSILGRWAQPSEMVGAVVYLASDASSFVTGTTIFVDGGWTAADGRFAPPT